MGAILIALIFWQLLSLYIHQSILLVGPIEVLKQLGLLVRDLSFWQVTWYTMRHIIGGFFLGLIAGLILGSLSGRFPALETLLWPWMACVKSVPVASMIVILLIWLRAGNLSIFISFLIVLPVIYQNTLSGVRARDKQMLEMAQGFRIHGLRKLWYIDLPMMKPFLLSAVSTAAGMAWKAGVAAEIIGTPQGSIGQRLYLDKTYLDTADLLAWTVVLVLLSVVFEKLLVGILKKILP